MGFINFTALPDPPLDAASQSKTTPGYHFEELCDGCVLAYTIRSIEWEALKPAFDDLRQRVETWPEDRPLLILMDMTDPSLVFTPRIRQEVDAIIKMISGQQGRIATVMIQSILLQVARLYTSLRPLKKMQHRILFDRNEALSWLMEAYETSFWKD